MDVPPPADVVAVLAREQPPRLRLALADQGERHELDPEQLRHLVEEDAPGRFGIVRPGERIRDRRDGLQLAASGADQLLRLARPHPACEDISPVAPAEQEEQSRNERDHAGRERDPEMAADRAAVVRDHDPEDRERDSDARKHQRERDIGQREPRPLAPEPRGERRAHAEVGGREDEQRHRVEQHGLVFRAHWARRMIDRRQAAAAFAARARAR